MRNTGWKIGVGGDRVIKEFPEYADVYLAFDDVLVKIFNLKFVFS